MTLQALRSTGIAIVTLLALALTGCATAVEHEMTGKGYVRSTLAGPPDLLLHVT